MGCTRRVIGSLEQGPWHDILSAERKCEGRGEAGSLRPPLAGWQRRSLYLVPASLGTNSTNAADGSCGTGVILACRGMVGGAMYEGQWRGGALTRGWSANQSVSGKRNEESDLGVKSSLS